MNPSPATNSINGHSPAYLEALYQSWLRDPASVGAEWSAFFRGFALAAEGATPGQLAGGVGAGVPAGSSPQVQALVNFFRARGHTVAHLNCLADPVEPGMWPALGEFNIGASDVDREVDASAFTGLGRMTLRALLEVLRQTYTRTIGCEFMHITDPDQRRWFQERVEPARASQRFSREQKLRILGMIARAEGYEQYAQKNYQGSKRFSLEGCETLIPMLDELVEASGEQGVEEIVFGMAHRGRLSVLANILNKPYSVIFAEYEDHADEDSPDAGGDVKYHKGASTDRITRSGRTVHLTMTPNPSHLEMGGAVVEGRTRAKQFLKNDHDRRRIVPCVMHGDGAVIGQGIVAETFNMSQLDGFKTGGTIHIVINNQVAFTTAVRDGRSTPYCTDVAKIVEAPVFHVNAEDPEAAVYLIRLALEYRQAWGRDVVIDLIGFRKYGHNEQDEPAFTQPLMYEVIRRKRTVREVYAARLRDEGILNEEEFAKHNADFRAALEKAQEDAKHVDLGKSIDVFGQGWSGIAEKYSPARVETGVAAKTLQRLAEKLAAFPADFTPNPKVKKLYTDRLAAVTRGTGIDWGNAETLAYASLLEEGFQIRLTGQDVRRGTFSHRHASLMDAKQEGRRHEPLNHLAESQGQFCVFDSPLSELSVVAFEYGFSLVAPNVLTIWEAQFGDFGNCAQAIIDEYIVSGEVKWDRHSGLVMLLPHGYEGAGPDHSSARPERFLQMCAEDNVQVCYPSSASQIFHLLRRQMRQPFRRPLVVMTPKSLLRLPAAQCAIEDLTSGSYRELIGDASVKAEHVSRVMLCSGKVYYELDEMRRKQNLTDVAIVRMEQWYPWPEQALIEALKPFRTAKQWLWVQEEPQNMGAWSFVWPRLREQLNVEIDYVGRPEAASPATGSHHAHAIEQARLLETALGVRSRGSEVPAGKK